MTNDPSPASLSRRKPLGNSQKITPGPELVHRFFSGTGTTYDFMVNFWTFGVDGWWKKKILKKIPQRPVRIIDQASGTGILTFKIARRFPACKVIGVELRYEYLTLAKNKARASEIRNVDFIQGRAEDVTLNEPIDCITSSYLAKYAEFQTLIPNAKKMLKKGGLLIMHDFTYPPGRVLGPLWEFFFKIMQGVGTRVYPQWRIIFYELPVLLRQTTWVHDLVQSLRKNGFSGITVEPLTRGTSTMVTARKP